MITQYSGKDKTIEGVKQSVVARGLLSRKVA